MASGKITEYAKEIKKAAAAIKHATAMVVTAGAGIGVDSGLPDFRGPQGFWRAYPPLKDKGLRLEQMSTPHWFHSDPTFAWGFFGHRYNLYSTTQPHRGFNILLKWCQTMQHGHFVFTSNVDGHFQKAGFAEDKVVECHGSINFMQSCDSDKHGADIWPVAPETKYEVDTETLRLQSPLPQGPPGKNDTLARPNILMFGDWSWISDRTDAQSQRFQEFCSSLYEQKSSRLVVVEIGAGEYVPTVRFQSESLNSRHRNSTLIRINPRDWQVPSGGQNTAISLPMAGLEALDFIDKELQEQ